jgi:magnesium-transporting ATPase (P-type)
VIRDAIARVPLISRTFMVDSYRRGVKRGIQRLYKDGKQVFICTGDSTAAAKTIATNLDFPPTRIDLDGSDEESLIVSLRNAILKQEEPIEPPSPAIFFHDTAQEPAEKPLQSLTIFVDQSCMELFKTIQEREGGYKGIAFDLFFKLIEARKPDKPNKIGKSLNYIVFCRATPALKPWVVQLMQHGHPPPKPSLDHYSMATYISNWIRRIFNPGRHYVLAIGDGANDINMIKVADASMGIRSTDTSEDVCNAASVWHTEWKPVVTLLLEDGPEKATLLSTMVKATFLKHWMTAMALWADLLFTGFTLFPMDPTHPMLMMFYNGVVFMQIASHTGHDVVPGRIRAQLRIKNLMSVRAFLRWAMAAILSGFAIDWIVRSLFPDARPNEFGAMIQVAQSCSITVYLLLSTNAWTDHEKQKEKEQVAAALEDVKNAVIGIITIILGIAAFFLALQLTQEFHIRFGIGIVIITAIWFSGRALLVMIHRDMNHMRNTINWKTFTNDTTGTVKKFIAWSHTKNGRLLPILVFTFAIKIITGRSVQFIALVIISALTSTASIGIFLVVISRRGFMRALLDGKGIAIAVVAFLLGIYVGRITCITTP